MGDAAMEKVFEYGWWLPPDVSVHGARIDNIITLLHWFMLVLFIGWGAFLMYTLFKFRARPGRWSTCPWRCISSCCPTRSVGWIRCWTPWAERAKRR